MAETSSEYVVRDYSAIDKQIEEVARREKTVTDKMRIQNYEKMAIIAGGLALVAGIVFFLICWGIRIVKGPPEVKVIEVSNNTQETSQNDSKDIQQIFKNDELNEKNENIRYIQQERNKILQYERDNQELENLILESEKNIKVEIQEIKERRNNLKEDINKKYEIDERVLKERLINEQERLENLKITNAPVEEKEKVKTNILKIDGEISEFSEKKKTDFEKTEKKLENEINEKNKILQETKKEIRKKITNNKKAIQLSKKNINNQESKNQNPSNQNVKKNITMFKFVDIADGTIDSVTTRHIYDSANQSRPNNESCYASYRKISGENAWIDIAYKDPSGIVKSYYNRTNPFKLTKAQWDSYIRSCKWFQ